MASPSSSSAAGPGEPWRDRTALVRLAAALTHDLGGRPVHDLVGGAGWAALHLAGDDRPVVVLAALPGATLAFACRGPLPAPLRRALERSGRQPPPLAGHRFADAAVADEDLVLALRLTGPDGDRHLLHQLFGNPGNTALLDAEGRLLWAHRRPPHPCLLAPPRPAPTAAPAALDEATGFAADGIARLVRQREAALGDQLRRALQRRRTAAERLVANLAADLAGADRGEEVRRDAEALAAHLSEAVPGAAEIVLADPRDGTPRRIPLDPAAPAATTLDRLFRAARRAERGRDVIAARLEEAARAVAAAQAAEAALAAAAGAGAGPPLARLAALLVLRERELGPLATTAPAGAAGRAAEAAPRPFRRYRLQDRWEVWVGRDNQENDRLTHRESHPRDLWFHAQGVPGSHVILRTAGRPEQVPRAVIEQAAALAALHSRARHSALAPVIWTERRYVRKPRKAAPGVAVCLRERSLFVAPGLPAGATPF